MINYVPPAIHRLLLRVAHRVRHRWRKALKRPIAGVSVIATNAEGRVLLVRHSYGPKQWALPGGGLGRGEDPAAAARRELHEELRCDLLTIEHVATLHETISGAPHTAHVFAGALANEPRPDGREVIEARFFAADDLPDDLSRLSRLRIAEWRAAKG